MVVIFWICDTLINIMNLNNGGAPFDASIFKIDNHIKFLMLFRYNT